MPNYVADDASFIAAKLKEIEAEKAAARNKAAEPEATETKAEPEKPYGGDDYYMGCD